MVSNRSRANNKWPKNIVVFAPVLSAIAAIIAVIIGQGGLVELLAGNSSDKTDASPESIDINVTEKGNVTAEGGNAKISVADVNVHSGNSDLITRPQPSSNPNISSQSSSKTNVPQTHSNAIANNPVKVAQTIPTIQQPRVEETQVAQPIEHDNSVSVKDGIHNSGGGTINVGGSHDNRYQTYVEAEEVDSDVQTIIGDNNNQIDDIKNSYINIQR